MDSTASRLEAPAARHTSRRLGGVDGLRAAAALWVVLFHIRAFSGARLRAVPGLDLAIRSGSTGVSLFLVLSGFCLFVPYAGGRASRFQTKVFLVRRCRRLMPAYYASLVAIVIVYLVAGGHAGLPRLGPAAMARQTAAHVALVQQLFPRTFYGFNGAYWSLGLEWELYLTLPFLIIGARRFGLYRTVAAAIAVNVVYRLLLAVAISQHLVAAHGALATIVLPNLFLGRWAEFALGMLAADLYRRGRVAVWGRRLRWVALPLVAGGILAVGTPLDHLVFGAVFFALLCVVLAGDNFVARVFSWRPLVVLGTMSYSLYLVHQPLVQIFAAALGAGHGAKPTTVFLELILLIPVLVFAAWLLFIMVERHSLTTGAVEDLPGRWLLFPNWAGFRTAAAAPARWLANGGLLRRGHQPAGLAAEVLGGGKEAPRLSQETTGS